MHDAVSFADAMYEARLRGDAWPLPSAALKGFSTADAYAVQTRFVARCAQRDPLAGYKAGATAVPAQQAFGLEAPFSGVLLSSGQRNNGCSVDAGSFRRLILETELCFRIGSEVTEPCDDVDELMERVEVVCAAIELAEVGGFGASRFTGLDLIAGNGAAAGYILAPQPDWASFNLDEVAVRFARNGELLHEATAGDLMTGQWGALRWLVNQVLSLGYQLLPGHLLLTGSLGSPHAGEPGSYEADFGDFGCMSFEVT